MNPAPETEHIDEAANTISFKTWLAGKPYWEQFLWEIHGKTDAPDNVSIEKCYQYLLEDNNVIPKSVTRAKTISPSFNFDDTEESSSHFTIQKIDNLENINAIDSECEIVFGKELTIIYGDNGSGKSGIGRLLSNACNSRKPRKLLPNAKIAHVIGTTAKADFHIDSELGTKLITYSFGENHPELKSFSVFDHECATIHLNSENKVEFVPAKLQVFDEVFKSIQVLEGMLQNEIRLTEVVNPVADVFTYYSEVKAFTDKLSYKTTEEEIKLNLDFTAEDKIRLKTAKEALKEKEKLDISKEKKDLNDSWIALNTYKQTLEASVVAFTRTKAIEINALIKSIHEKREIVSKLSAKNFEFDAFQHIGSPEWKSLIIAAERLYQKEVSSLGGKELDLCILCRQSIGAKEHTLFHNYWDFLKSTAEQELDMATRNLNDELARFTLIYNNLPSFSDSIIAVKILESENPEKFKRLKDEYVHFKVELLEKWLKQMKAEQSVKDIYPPSDFYWVSDLVGTKKSAIAALVDPATEIDALKKVIFNLAQKDLASGLVPKIIKYVQWLKWKNSVDSINFSAVKANTTRKKAELMSQLVIGKYIEVFNEETTNLNSNFGLKIETHGREVAMIKGLRLEFAPGITPGEILSEGEQTVSALADFLTESRLNKGNCGIIFDDPVNSLDHLRKATIAQRLSFEAKNRQVIVLTHDIAFLSLLKYYSDLHSIVPKITSIRKNGDKVGLIKDELPWVAQELKNRVGYLRDDLIKVKKLENGDPDDYRARVKAWYGLLYEGWERAIEERVFKKVVQRFSAEIQPKRIDKVIVDDELKSAILTGMSEASKWRHDQAAILNLGTPTHLQLEKELEYLSTFADKYKAD